MPYAQKRSTPADRLGAMPAKKGQAPVCLDV
jgi:hypothetical protein